MGKTTSLTPLGRAARRDECISVEITVSLPPDKTKTGRFNLLQIYVLSVSWLIRPPSRILSDLIPNAILARNLITVSEVFSGGYQQNDLQVADQILGGNVDKIINAHNSENFTADVYEEVVACYRALAKQLMERAETIINNQSKWNELKNTSIETLKRMRAG